ncbi:WD40 repeat domain-containing protein [Streptomyces sp. MAI_2237]
MRQIRFTHRRLAVWCLGIILVATAASIAIRATSAPDSRSTPTATGPRSATTTAPSTPRPAPRRIRTLRPGNWVTSLAFSPNGKLLASATNYGTVQLWNVANGDLLATLDKLALADAAPNKITFSPDGKKLAVCCVPRFQLVDVASGKILHSRTSPNTHVAFAPNGKQLALGGQYGMQFTDADGQFRLFRNTYVGELAYSPDGSVLASSGGVRVRGGGIQIWNPATESVRSALQARGPDDPPDEVESLAFSPDGTTIATGGSTTDNDTGSLVLWKVATGATTRLGTAIAHDPVHGIAYAPDGHVLASVDDIGRLRLWDTTTKQQLAVLPTAGALQSVAVSPHGGLLATGSSGGAITLWDVSAFIPTGKKLAEHPRPPSLAPGPTLSGSGPGSAVGAQTDCGSAQAGSRDDAFHVVVTSGHVSCADARRILKNYAKARGKQGSAGLAVIDGWSCGHNSTVGLAQTGVYIDCQRGTDEFDTQRS